ncbi:MAG: type II toxin-antitoxin system HicA family toxin [Deltaproteobacteria bacterium]|jgi:hypothetical protein|nr:type II toxin-antitoxin system HicA family toxin [Deltaproteobacteria bacterium]
MNSKHLKTLQTVYALPTIKDLDWKDLETLFTALGAEIIEGDGSRVKFVLNGKVIRFHRPHKPKTARAYQIELAREFFESMGIKS